MTRGPELYENVKRQEENWLRGTVQKRITDSISSTLVRAQAATEIQDQSEERRAAGEKFLSAFKEAWEDHQLCMSMITDVLMYMVSLNHPGDTNDIVIGLSNVPRRTASFPRTNPSPRSTLSQWPYFAIMFFEPRSAPSPRQVSPIFLNRRFSS